MLPSDLSRIFTTHPEFFRMELNFRDTPPAERVFDVPILKNEETHLTKQYFHAIEMPPLFTHLALIQFQIWLASGFGDLEIRHERVKSDKIKVHVRACPDYLYYISTKELQVIQMWCEQVQIQLQQRW